MNYRVDEEVKTALLITTAVTIVVCVAIFTVGWVNRMNNQQFIDAGYKFIPNKNGQWQKTQEPNE
jgi:hypothetical protein